MAEDDNSTSYLESLKNLLKTVESELLSVSQNKAKVIQYLKENEDALYENVQVKANNLVSLAENVDYKRPYFTLENGIVPPLPRTVLAQHVSIFYIPMLLSLLRKGFISLPI